MDRERREVSSARQNDACQRLWESPNLVRDYWTRQNNGARASPIEECVVDPLVQVVKVENSPLVVHSAASTDKQTGKM